MKTGFKLFFVESICDDPKIIETNILEVKVTSPDYKHFDKETILHDFLERINHYEKLYGQAHDIFFTNFPNPNLQIFSTKYYVILFGFSQKLKTEEKKCFFRPIYMEFVFFFNWEILVEKFVDSYLENSWKHVVSSILETLDENLEPDLAYLKIFDTGRKVTVHKHEGHIQARIVYYLMNVRITPRTIYLTRHGESYNNVIGIQY